MPILKSGWELHIVRSGMQTRRGRSRTIGTYEVFHDGNPVRGLAGAAVETKGPGSNKVMGNGRRIEAGTYPLATHAGPHYCTIGYLVSADPDQTPKPALEVKGVAPRDGILIHPGHGFLASVGCINLSASLANANADVPFVDSRDRVIAVINDLRAYLEAVFPHFNNQSINGASVVIEGEP